MGSVEGGLCTRWSAKFKGQCIIPYDCDETCRLKEGGIEGDCVWTGFKKGYACICTFDIEAVGNEICEVFSGTFRGQCYVSSHCETNCNKEGYPSGQCEWRGTNWGFACMCQYLC
ncbi:hypothetical protein H5410_034940 [Solanum commersonii]|uniref:Knottins-like domain-containing protein n=1 Tax=Solanum commersonii TaxID=4109 RepID=A0A9J5Y350_SOLCO|nr:hypothetical protein H5410_034940 [Solanum commersonii]